MEECHQNFFGGKKIQTFSIFKLLFWSRNGGVRPKKLKCLQKIWHRYTLFIDISSGRRCMRFTESSHQRFVRGKKTLKTEIFRLLFYAETEKYNQEDWNISDTFGIITLLLPTYHLEVGVPFSVKLATKASFESKKTFLNEKSRSATKKNQVYLINLECLCLA